MNVNDRFGMVVEHTSREDHISEDIFQIRPDDAVVGSPPVPLPSTEYAASLDGFSPASQRLFSSPSLHSYTSNRTKNRASRPSI